MPVRRQDTSPLFFTVAQWSKLKQLPLEGKPRKTETVTDPKAQNGSDLFTSQFNATKPFIKIT